MANPEIFKELMKAILQHGSKEVAGDNRIITMSELSLVAHVEEGKTRPLAIIFPLFGLDFIMLPEGTLSISDPDDEENYLDLQDEDTLKQVESYLSWRIQAISQISL